MSLFKQPSELQPKFAISALIYGSPGSGKSTLACSAPNAVLLDYDGGVTRMHGAHQIPTLQIQQWEQTAEALKEIKATPQIETVVVDTIGKMLAYMEDYIKRHPTYSKGGNAIEMNRDGSLSMKGFGRRKQMFLDFLKEVLVMGKHIIFVGHDKEEKRGDAGQDIIIRPEVGGSSANDLMKELDLVGYVEMVGTKRTISFTPCEKYYAKNTCNMPGKIEIPVIINDKGNPIPYKDAEGVEHDTNDFMVGVIEAYKKRQSDNLAQTAEYERLCAEIAERASHIENAKDANDFRTWALEQKHIFNSGLKVKLALDAKAKELGLVQNKSTKEYADPEPKPASE